MITSFAYFIEGNCVAGAPANDDACFIGQGTTVASSAKIIEDRSPSRILNQERCML
jgi:hypothetical protein